MGVVRVYRNGDIMRYSSYKPPTRPPLPPRPFLKPKEDKMSTEKFTILGETVVVDKEDKYVKYAGKKHYFNLNSRLSSVQVSNWEHFVAANLFMVIIFIIFFPLIAFVPSAGAEEAAGVLVALQVNLMIFAIVNFIALAITYANKNIHFCRPFDKVLSKVEDRIFKEKSLDIRLQDKISQYRIMESELGEE